MVPDTPQGWIAAVGVIIATAFTFYKNYRDTMQAAPKASPVPPARHYTEQDVMAAYAEVRENYRELRDIVQRHHGMTADDMKDMIRVLDRMERMVERMEGQMNRIETSQRVTEAMHNLQHKERDR